MAGSSVGVVATAGSVPPNLSDGGSSLGPLSIVTRTFLVATTFFVVVGLVGEGRPAWTRARRRVAITAATGEDPPGSAIGPLLRAFGEEIAPGRSRAHRAAVRERSRIARELHAEVVPAVRRAIAEAEDGGSIERLASALRDVLDEVDGLVQSQRAIQLEIGGLVPALEWLAERVEERSDVRVVITVSDPPGGLGEPPPDVQAAAYRIADLALENARRHAPGATVEVAVASGIDSVSLTIGDDGPGLRSTSRSGPGEGRPGRGLIDMAEEAAGCGGGLDIEQPADGGTVVRFTWGLAGRAVTGRPATSVPGDAGFHAPAG
jgi:signal transduction histidine kinase